MRPGIFFSPDFYHLRPLHFPRQVKYWALNIQYKTEVFLLFRGSEVGICGSAMFSLVLANSSRLCDFLFKSARSFIPALVRAFLYLRTCSYQFLRNQPPVLGSSSFPINTSRIDFPFRPGLPFVPSFLRTFRGLLRRPRKLLIVGF